MSAPRKVSVSERGGCVQQSWLWFPVLHCLPVCFPWLKRVQQPVCKPSQEGHTTSRKRSKQKKREETMSKKNCIPVRYTKVTWTSIVCLMEKTRLSKKQTVIASTWEQLLDSSLSLCLSVYMLYFPPFSTQLLCVIVFLIMNVKVWPEVHWLNFAVDVFFHAHWSAVHVFLKSWNF